MILGGRAGFEPAPVQNGGRPWLPAASSACSSQLSYRPHEIFICPIEQEQAYASLPPD